MKVADRVLNEIRACVILRGSDITIEQLKKATVHDLLRECESNHITLSAELEDNRRVGVYYSTMERT